MKLHIPTLILIGIITICISLGYQLIKHWNESSAQELGAGAGILIVFAIVGLLLHSLIKNKTI